jgi:hypothetical protein
MKESALQGEKILDRVKRVGMVILGVSENRNWIELLYEGDLAHSKRIELPSGTLFDILIEEVPHKTTVFEYPCTLVYFDGPCDVEICQEGGRVVIRGCQAEAEKSAKDEG